MRNTARQTRENRTITVDFQNEATYFQLLDDGKAFLECVLAFVMSLGFQLKHKTTCRGGGCLTRHSHHVRIRLGDLTIWRLQCTMCKAVIGFYDPLQKLLVPLIRQGGIAQPPAPPIARPDMDPHLPRNTPGRAGEAQPKGGEHPVRQRPLALVQESLGEIVEGALAAVAPVAFASRPVVVCAPAANVMALAPRALQRPVFPS